ncbi:MAG: ATP-binding protein [Sphingomicrobium sp.]
MTDEHQLLMLGARRIVTDTDPDELVLPEEAGRRLGWIANWLSQPAYIFRDWGLNRYVDGGFRALFRGPAGTGKTMAAVALGRSAGRPLFHVDLGPVSSNYIGETEKNLRQLFEAAEEEGAILLFDEADALVGKLLRRIERFEGLAIIASDGSATIEEAALARIDVMVDFPRPGEAAREAIWRKLLAAVKLPQAGGIDARHLAKANELTGAEILRCVRAASLIAAVDDRKIDMELLQTVASERLAMRERTTA